jgi:uncharacterized protein (TIGR03382 family)
MRIERAMLLGAMVAASSALATPTFPSVLQTELKITTVPACAVCHLNGVTSAGTVTTPFGKALRMNGLVANDDASLKTALAAVKTANSDSDADGCTDVDELVAGTNPNKAGDCGGGGTGGGTATTLPPIKYGCGASSVPGALGVLAVALLIRRRRR